MELANGFEGSKKERAQLPYHLKDRKGSLKLKQLRKLIEDSRLDDHNLFDSRYWTQNYEQGLKMAWSDYLKGELKDIEVKGTQEKRTGWELEADDDQFDFDSKHDEKLMDEKIPFNEQEHIDEILGLSEEDLLAMHQNL